MILAQEPYWNYHTNISFPLMKMFISNENNEKDNTGISFLYTALKTHTSWLHTKF